MQSAKRQNSGKSAIVAWRVDHFDVFGELYG
jgi:hypothetical protein